MGQVYHRRVSNDNVGDAILRGHLLDLKLSPSSLRETLQIMPEDLFAGQAVKLGFLLAPDVSRLISRRSKYPFHFARAERLLDRVMIVEIEVLRNQDHRKRVH